MKNIWRLLKNLIYKLILIYKNKIKILLENEIDLNKY